MSSSRQNSRFSTLKVFKFASAAKPPPPPPKDPYYLPNHSLASLSQTLPPETFTPPFATNPNTPLSAGYASRARSPSPSPSYTPSFAPSQTSQAPSCYDLARTRLGPSTTSLSPPSADSRKGFSFKFGSLGKRPKTPKSPPSVANGSLPLETADDPSISMPWNFQVRGPSGFAYGLSSVNTSFRVQHNVHVDEAYVFRVSIVCMLTRVYSFAGLPPTWSASLAEMGFSPEEIAGIHARRAASKPSTLYALQSNRSDSPASSTHSAITRPMPRSTSLMRDSDTMSQRSESSYAADVSRNISMSTDDSDTSMTVTERVISSIYTTSPQTMRPVDRQSQFTITAISPHSPQAQPGPSRVPESKDSRPRTPTKRNYHVANNSVGSMSPPPAYRSPKKEAALDDVDDELMLPPPIIGTPARPEEDELDGEDPADLPPVSSRSGVRTSALPPRLSLHHDTSSDLASWTESLFSMIPSTPPKKSIPQSSPHSTPSTSSSSQPRSSSPTRTHPPRSTSSSPQRHRQLPSQKLLPIRVTKAPCPPSPSSPGLLPPPSASSTNPLWQEVYNMVRSPDSGSASPSPLGSPLFPPVTPGTTTSPATSVDVSGAYGDELYVDYSKDRENRDSATSTITVTPATISSVSIVKRARANVVKSPARENSQRRSTRSSITSTAGDNTFDDKASARSNSPVSSDSTSSEAMSLSTFPSVPSADDDKGLDSQNWKAGHTLTSQTSSIPYVETSPQPSPLSGEFERTSIITSAAVREYRQQDAATTIHERPSIVIDEMPQPNDELASPWPVSTEPSPATPSTRYPGWVSEVVAPLQSFIQAKSDPRALYSNLREIAEGESGSVYAARVVGAEEYVAIKQVALLPSGSQKLEELDRETSVMKQVRHQHILSMEAMYIDIVEDSLWIRMELMDRSLADILNLVEEGVQITEMHIAQFSRDVSDMPSSVFVVVRY